MLLPSTPAARAELGALASLVLFRSACSSLVLATGFRALSDDDYARVVIAQKFAEAPALDPSGTSWLPFPFWLHGSAMVLFGPTLEVARVLGFLQGIAATLLVYVAGRWLKQSRPTAFIAAALASAFPSSAWLGVAALPEAFTAALVVLAGAGLYSVGREGRDGRVITASLALLVASASRYEAWPVAAAFSAFCLIEAMTRRSRTALLALGLASLMPCAWLLHGIFRHADPFFFVERVTAYERALGPGRPLLDRIISFPLDLLRREPEIMGFALVGVFLCRRFGLSMQMLRPFRRSALLLVALLAFLVVGDVRGGAPTHHDERVLLAIWYAGCLIGASVWTRLLTHRRARPKAWAAACVACAAVSILLRPSSVEPHAFVDREAEIRMGRLARALVPRGAELLIDTEDFGYFAIMAGFERPAEAAAFDDHDPRKPRQPAFESHAALRQIVTGETVTEGGVSGIDARETGSRWFIATDAHATMAESVGTRRGSLPGFALYEVL